MRLGRIPGTALAVGAQVARPGPHFLGPSICGSARPLADRAPRVAPAAPFVSFPAVIVPRLATLKGVGQINIGGGTKYALRIQLNPAALAAAGIAVGHSAPHTRTTIRNPSPDDAARANGAVHQWRKYPPRELSVDPGS